MGENFFKTFLGGGGNNSFCQFARASGGTVNDHLQQQQQQQQQQQPAFSGKDSSTTDSPQHLNVSMGTDNKHCFISRNANFKELTSTIKDLFGMNNKSTLCIKYENNNGDMYSVACDKQLQKATDDGKSAELRLVVKELAPPNIINSNSKKSDSLFSYFFGGNSSNGLNDAVSAGGVGLNFTASPSVSISSGSSGMMATPDFLKPKANQDQVALDSSASSVKDSNSNSLNNSFNNNINSNNNISQQKNYSPLSTGNLFKPISFSHIVNNKQSMYSQSVNYSTATTTTANKLSSSSTNSMPIPNTTSKPLSSSPKLIPSPTATNPSSLKNTKSPTSPSIPPINKNISQNDDIKMNRNLSFDFNMDLMDQDDKSTTSSHSNTNSPVPVDLKSSQDQLPRNSSNISLNSASSTPSCSSMMSNSGSINGQSQAPQVTPVQPLPVCVQQQQEQQGQCKEVSKFMSDITQLFLNLRGANSFSDQCEIKSNICDKIHNTLKTMPWILGVFPQLTHFINQTCPFSVPPNTPPPSPSQQVSPLFDIMMKNGGNKNSGVGCASVYEISNNSVATEATLNRQIQLLTHFDQEDKQQQQPPSSPSKNIHHQQGPFFKDQGPIVHKGTRCSMCSHSPIIGNLYRCSVCENFMFCESCKSESLSQIENQKCILPDKSHQIILITKPSATSNPQQGSNNLIDESSNSNNNNNNNSLNNPLLRGCPYQRKQFKCTYQVKFIADITIPLGSVAKPGQQLVKTWRVKNLGTCLPADCLLVRICGNTKLSKIPSVNLPSSIAVGESFNISIPFTVPQIPPQCNEYLVGEYWRLCTSDGLYFGDKLWLSLIIKNDNQSTEPLLEPFSNLKIQKSICNCGNLNCKCVSS